MKKPCRKKLTEMKNYLDRVFEEQPETPHGRFSKILSILIEDDLKPRSRTKKR